MKVATQNFILIVPVFLLLAVVTSVLVFVTELRDVRWGLESEAQGLAVTMAEFTNPAAVEALAAGGASEGELAGARAALDRIMALGRARRIALFHVSAGSARQVLDAGEPAAAPAAINNESLRRLALGDDVLPTVTGAGDRLVAYAPVRDDAGALRGVIAVETSLAPLGVRRASLLRRTAGVLLALFVVGALVSAALSVLMTREIGRLAQTARRFAAGDYDAPVRPGPIEEVAEVGSTLGIMGSVLRDATLRSTREMLQFERVRTDTQVAQYFAERFSKRVETESGGVRLAIDRLGGAPHGSFWFFRKDGDCCRACLGRVEEPASFETMLAASSCDALMQDGLDRREAAAEVLARAAAILPLHACVLLEWRAAGGAIVEHRLRAGAPVSLSELAVPAGKMVALTTLDEAADRRATSYADANSFNSPASCVEELRRFFGDGTPGGVLVLQVTSS